MIKFTTSISWKYIFTLIALVVSELLYFLSSAYKDTLVLVVPVKAQIMFSRFYRDYISHQVLEYITPFLISPVLFLFPSSHLISTFFYVCKLIKSFTFVNLFEGIVVNIPNAIQTGFHTFCQGEFFKFIQIASNLQNTRPTHSNTQIQ